VTSARRLGVPGVLQVNDAVPKRLIALPEDRGNELAVSGGATRKPGGQRNEHTGMVAATAETVTGDPSEVGDVLGHESEAAIDRRREYIAVGTSG
jgi:hypothetical protein